MPATAPAHATSATTSGLAGLAPYVDHWTVGMVLLLGVLAVVGYQAMLPIRNPDFGWHVALGRWIVEHGALPSTEPFTHTAVGKPTVLPQWLSQVLFYLVARAGGFLGLRWAYAATVLTILGLLYVWLRQEKVPPALAAFGVLAYVAVAQPRFQQRPLIIDLLAQVVMYGWVFVQKPALTPRQMIAITLASILWANLYAGGYTTFPTLLAIYTAVEALQQWTGWRKPQPTDLGGGDLRKLALLTVIAAVVTFATPTHVRLLSYIVETQEMNSGRSLEWLSMTKMWGHPTMTPFAVESFWLLLASTGVAALLSLRRESLATMAVVGFLAVLPLNGERFVAVYYAPVLFVFGTIAAWLGDRSRREIAPVVSLAAAALVVACTYPVMNYQGELGRYQQRLTRAWDFQVATFPIGAVRFMGEVDLTGKLFNQSDWGGYVLQELYTKYPIFIDGRWVEVGKDVFEASSAIDNLRPNAFDLLDKYDIDLILMPREWMPKQRIAERKWLPLFENFNAGVYVRNTPRNATNLQRAAEYYARYGVPFSSETGFGERQAVEANKTWATDFRVERAHLKLRTGTMVNGW
jgi:hypothetical protein